MQGTCSRARLSAWNIVDLPSVSMEIHDVLLHGTQRQRHAEVS